MRILLTAFEPYDEWTENSSWLTLVELLRDLPSTINLVTRRYPVDLAGLQTRLEKDLNQSFDAILHLGQSPGISSIKLESIAINVAGSVERKGEEFPPIVENGPLAFRSRLPLGRWAQELRNAKIPAQVSYHAGTFLCNATMYLTHFHFREALQAPRIGFIHLPLATEQVAASRLAMPSLTTSTMAQGIRLILEDIPLCEIEPADRRIASRKQTKTR